MEQETKDSSMGMVTSRECPFCGHHEIGFVTQDGEFHPLKAGTFIRVFEQPSSAGPVRDTSESPLQTEEAEQTEHRIWIPEPLRGDRLLRLKYSVLVTHHLFKGEMSGRVYESAYVGKLERLTDKAPDTPLPVILDRFFSAPHLASGNPQQIAEAMYRELDEIKRPVVLMRNWLERRDEQSLAELIAPKSLEDLGRESAADARIEKELEALSLEEFLEML